MAIREHDREDLLGEGRNMPWRGQCIVDGAKVVVGFREQGQTSLFCGADPVFQFNSQHQLRRVFFRGTRYRAENHQLVAMSRSSRGGRVEFDSTPIHAETASELSASLSNWLLQIRSALHSASWQVEGESVEAFRSRLASWLDSLQEPIAIAPRPNV